MITTANNTSYEASALAVTATNAQLSYIVSNPAVQALGFPVSGCALDISAMPAIQVFFLSPMHNQLPTLADVEQWIVGDHSADGQRALQAFTGAAIS